MNLLTIGIPIKNIEIILEKNELNISMNNKNGFDVIDALVLINLVDNTMRGRSVISSNAFVIPNNSEMFYSRLEILSRFFDGQK